MKIAIAVVVVLNLLSSACAICPETIAGLKRWSDASTWIGGVPVDGETVVITEGILLDTVTSKLQAVFVTDGGRLVFDPEAQLAKLVTGKLDIGNEGYVDIGSFDCEFQGNAEILLLGNRTSNDNEMDELFGDKFVGVREGGSFEVHGKEKRSWTKLTATVPAAKHAYSAAENQPTNFGLHLYEFDVATGKPIGIKETNNLDTLKSALDQLVSSDSTLLLINRGTNGNSGNIDIFETWSQAVDELEAKLGCTLGLRSEWTCQNDAWVLLVDRSGQGATCVEEINHLDGVDDVEAETEKICQDIGDWTFAVQNRISTVSDGNYRFDCEVFEKGHGEVTIKLLDDVSSWNVGDEVVFASTDYDFGQAEEKKIRSIVDATTITVDGPFMYEHYGEIYEGVDMRGEVGMLTRNILIHGEVGTTCHGGILSRCEDIHFDGFGGHTKAIKGFKAYNVVGAEFKNMGQTANLGRYPIHFHMAEDVDAGGNNPLVARNSIHHCLNRCITIHGTHGVHVKDNVAHDTIGHCFFLEDGGEKRTVYDGNLGLTTRKGTLIPSDAQPTTFWITSPLTTFVNNVAAGSELRRGFGIWFLFPDEPVSKSYGMGFFKEKEASHTMITKWANNVAHSNGDKGFALFKRLAEDHGIRPCSIYDPWINPRKVSEGRAPVIFDGFTGYKNRKTNVILRSTTFEARNFRLAESLVGVEFNRIMKSGYQLFEDSTIIGETPNTGAGEKILLAGEWTEYGESIPDPYDPHEIMTGVYIDAEGPLHVRNVEFKNLQHTELRKGCGFLFRDEYRQGMALSSSVSKLSFNYDNGVGAGEGNYVCHENKIEGREETSMMLRDADGSLTGVVGGRIVSPDPRLHDGMECENMGDWNMSLCLGRFGRVVVLPQPEVAGDNFLTNINDLEKTQQEQTDSGTGKVKFVGYTINSEQIYIVNWAMGAPKSFSARALGLEQGESLIMGFCLPMGVKSLLESWTLNLWDLTVFTNIVMADSLEDLKNDDALNKTIFYDGETGILYYKFIEKRPREEGFYGDCLGGLEVNKYNCPLIKVKLIKTLDYGVDLSDGDCTAR